jgi:hypothetical protein
MNTLTKLFIVLQLVFSIAVSVIVVMTVSSMPKYKEQVEAWQKATIAAQAALAREVADTNTKQLVVAQQAHTIATQSTEIQRLNNTFPDQIAIEKTRNAGLEARITELSTANAAAAEAVKAFQKQLEAQSVELVKEKGNALKYQAFAAETNRKNEILTQEKSALTSLLKNTQEKLVETEQRYEILKNAPKQNAMAGGGAAGGNVGGPTPNISAGLETPINGPVGIVDSREGRTYFTLTLGTRDGLQKGMTLIVSRGNNYIGDAEIINTKVNEAVAIVKTLKTGQSVQAGDLVTVTK